MPLKLDVLIGSIVFVIVLSVISGILVLRRGRGVSGDSYLYGDKKIGPWYAGVTLGLSSIGALHCTGFMESGATLGIVTMWFAVGTGIMFAVVGGFFGPIYRKLGLNTIPQIFANIFDLKTRVMSSIIALVFCFSLLSLETQGGAIIITAITGIDLRVALFIFMICALVYMLISGMWQIAYVNIINAIVMYAAVIIAFIIVTLKLPAGWSGVDAFYIGQGLGNVLEFWPSDVNVLLGFAIAFGFAVTFTDSTDQGTIQYALTAADAKTASKAGFIAVLVNSPFAIFTVAFGLASFSIAEFSAFGPKMSGPAMLLSYLPTFLVVFVLGSFLLVVFSTFARCTMAISQIIINDVYLLLTKADDSQKQRTVPWLSRILIIVAGVGSVIPAYFLPHILLAGIFVFTLGIPLFIMMVSGLFWKRNSDAAFITMVVGIIVTFVWEYSGLATLLGTPGWFNSVYMTLFVSVILGVGLTALLPGKPGLLRKKRVDAVTESV
ncbi:MAG: hypothetical protein GX996_02645 [Firmicutes bacterium]|nr:hypothetical protein [Bacillota bacterium]